MAAMWHSFLPFLGNLFSISHFPHPVIRTPAVSSPCFHPLEPHATSPAHIIHPAMYPCLHTLIRHLLRSMETSPRPGIPTPCNCYINQHKNTSWRCHLWKTSKFAPSVLHTTTSIYPDGDWQGKCQAWADDSERPSNGTLSMLEMWGGRLNDKGRGGGRDPSIVLPGPMWALLDLTGGSAACC